VTDAQALPRVRGTACMGLMRAAHLVVRAQLVYTPIDGSQGRYGAAQTSVSRKGT
jgi:hypothetical protein